MLPENLQKRLSDETIDAVLALRKPGLPYSEIGRRLGISKNAAVSIGQRFATRSADAIIARYLRRRAAP